MRLVWVPVLCCAWLGCETQRSQPQGLQSFRVTLLSAAAGAAGNGQFAAACATDTDCQDGICAPLPKTEPRPSTWMSGWTSIGVCSRSCIFDDECPANFGCRDTGSRRVCVPLLPFSAEPRAVFVDIEALDTRGEPLATHSGPVKVSVVPGQVTGVEPRDVVLQNGRATGIKVFGRRSFGPTSVVVEDASATNDAALGASEALFFQNPRIRDVQEPTGSRDTSPMLNTVVTIDRGENVVVQVSNSGFFVVDRAEQEYASAFAFNFSRPEGIRRGDRLRSFSGQVLEFLGLTEIGFPIWDVDFRCPSPGNPGQLCDEGQFCIDGTCLGQECGDRVCAEGSVCEANQCVGNRNIPNPKIVNDAFGNNTELEKYESALVKVTNVINASEFKACDDPIVNPGANGNGTCEFCRTCRGNRDLNGVCMTGSGCCPVGQVCNVGAGECTSACDSNRDENGRCPEGKVCCPEGACGLGLANRLIGVKGMCGGCTAAERAEDRCDKECAAREPSSAGGLCSNLCDFREHGQYRVGIADEEGRWNGKSFIMITKDTIPAFRAADFPGKRFPSVTGIMRNLYVPSAIWFVEPRDECDVEGIDRQRTDCHTVR